MDLLTKDGQLTVGVNFEGSLKSRFLYAGVPKVLYKNPADFKEIFEAYKNDLEPLVTDGFLVDDERFYLALINSKGDLPANISLGGLTRSFRNVQKVVPKATGKRKSPIGICWRCSAGQKDYPFEDNSPEAAWIETVGLQPGFPAEPCSLLQLGHDEADPGSFFAFDIWHCDAQGDSQGFWGSSAVLCLDLLPAGSIEGKLQRLTADIEAHTMPSHPKCLPITRDKLSWNSAADYPSMQWSKASDAATLHVWLEGFLRRYQDSIKALPNDKQIIFDTMLKAVTAKNFLIRSLYECPLWIESSDALPIARAGFDYLREQRRLVFLSYQVDRHLFMWQPKTHYLGHIIHSFFYGASACDFALNPLVDSVQMDEDFVGRPSRLARRVTSKAFMSALRILQRYLINVRECWDAV